MQNQRGFSSALSTVVFHINRPSSCIYPRPTEYNTVDEEEPTTVQEGKTSEKLVQLFIKHLYKIHVFFSHNRSK
jgi:hypothetical protein